MKDRINQAQMKMARQEKEEMMQKKCNRTDCDNKGLHRCKRCKTVSVRLLKVFSHESLLMNLSLLLRASSIDGSAAALEIFISLCLTGGLLLPGLSQPTLGPPQESLSLIHI